jgi:hypothetical protein
MPEFKTYSRVGLRSLLAGASFIDNLEISSPQRVIKLLSVVLTWRMIDVTANRVLPWESNTTQDLQLVIGSLNVKFCNSFNKTGAMPLGFEAEQLNIYLPGQFNYKGIEFKNSIPLAVSLLNLSANPTDHSYSLTMITEEKIIY